MIVSPVLTITAFLAATGGQAMLSGPLTIDQAALIAERNAFAVRLQNTTVERDRQAIALALAGMGPSVGINSIFTQYGQSVLTSFGAGSAPVVVSPFQGGTTTVGLTLPIDISGNLGRLYAASRSTYQAARRNLEETFNDARLNARVAFLAVLRDQALVLVAQEAVKDAQGRLRQAQLQLAQQQIARIDVDRLDAQLAQSNSDLLNAQNTLQVAENAFNVALARPVETPVDLVDIVAIPELPSNTDLLARRAQGERPDARAILDQIQALAFVRRAQEAGLNPSMSLGLNYQRNLNPSFLSGNPNSVTATLGLNIPVFDSGATRARVREARQDEAAAKIQLQQLQLNISQEVRNSIKNMSSAQARLSNAERQVALAQEVFRLAQVRQDAGEGTYVEVVDAEASLEQARNSLVSAKYDYFLAYSQLQHGVGNDHVQEPATSQAVPGAAGVKP